IMIALKANNNVNFFIVLTPFILNSGHVKLMFINIKFNIKGVNTMKKFTLLLALSAIMILISACGASGEKNEDKGKDDSDKETITVKHELGETEVPKNPENVVVFDFGTLDTLDQLGIDVTGVPQATIPTYLEKYGSEDYENVGSLKEPDFEKIAEVDPGLIIISGRQSDLYDQLKDIAPTI